jgi:hypothetical protein
MATTINASTSAGLVSTADTSGVLQLQTAGTTALTVNTTGAIGVGTSPSYGTSGQVLTSAGSAAAPTWSTISVSAATPTALGTVYGTTNLAGTAPFYNTCIGYNAGLNLGSGGSANTIIGESAGLNKTSGNQCIYIGEGSRGGTVSTDGELVINASGNTVTGKGAATGFIVAGNTPGGIYQGNNSASWSVTSDARIKKNVVNVGDSLVKINSLRVVAFDYKENDRHEVGFIAQEFEQQFPEQIVRHEPNEAEKEWVGEDQVMGIQQNLVPFLVKAIQELSEKLDAANAANAALASRIATLEAK